MKKIFVFLLSLFCVLSVFGQPIIGRSGPANTVQDARWAAQYNAFLPRYLDTTAANVSRGIDSCGAIIYTYTGALWYRECSPKRWVQVGTGSSSDAWLLEGNAVADGDFLGSTNNRSLDFKTNSNLVATLDSNGRFGIGTQAPTRIFS